MYFIQTLYVYPHVHLITANLFPLIFQLSDRFCNRFRETNANVQISKQTTVSVRVSVCRALVQVWWRQKKKGKIRQKSVELGQHILFSFIQAQILCYCHLLTSCEHQGRSREARWDCINVMSRHWLSMGLTSKRAASFCPADSRDPFLEGLTHLKQHHKQRFHPLPLTVKTSSKKGRTMLLSSRNIRDLAAVGASSLG